MRKITRKFLDNNEETGYITIKEFENFSPKSLQFKKIINKEVLPVACFKFNRIGGKSGAYWQSIRIIKENE